MLEYAEDHDAQSDGWVEAQYGEDSRTYPSDVHTDLGTLCASHQLRLRPDFFSPLAIF